MKVLKIVNANTKEVVREVNVEGKSDRMIEKIMMGMLINIDTENYYIDDSFAEEVSK